MMTIFTAPHRRFGSPGPTLLAGAVCPTPTPVSVARSVARGTDVTGTQRRPHTCKQCTCGHPYDEHDPIGTRYCAATVANRLRRGCICMAPTLR